MAALGAHKPKLESYATPPKPTTPKALCPIHQIHADEFIAALGEVTQEEFSADPAHHGRPRPDLRCCCPPERPQDKNPVKPKTGSAFRLRGSAPTRHHQSNSSPLP